MLLTPAHLLTNHDDERGDGRAAVARDGEEFDEADNVVAPLSEDFGLGFELSVDIVEIASCGVM